MTKRLTGADDPRVTFELWCEPEFVSVEGNALASGDDAEDRAAEESIIAALDAGNEWAWCCVHVKASVEVDGVEFSGMDTLGCCSYESRADFERGGYYEDMKRQAFDALVSDLEAAVKRGDVSRRLLPRVSIFA